MNATLDHEKPPTLRICVACSSLLPEHLGTLHPACFAFLCNRCRARGICPGCGGPLRFPDLCSCLVEVVS